MSQYNQYNQYRKNDTNTNNHPLDSQINSKTLPINMNHTVQQLERLSYLLDKIQENTLSYQAEAADNNSMYLTLYGIIVIVGMVKDVGGVIIANNTLVSNEIQQYALLITSVIGIIIAAINVISNENGYQVKKSQFSAAVEKFDMLQDRIRFEMINPDENFNNFCQQLESEIESIKLQCEYQPSIANKAKYRKHSNRPDDVIVPMNTNHINGVSTHTGNRGKLARSKTAVMISDQMAAIRNNPKVLVQDFNESTISNIDGMARMSGMSRKSNIINAVDENDDLERPSLLINSKAKRNYGSCLNEMPDIFSEVKKESMPTTDYVYNYSDAYSINNSNHKPGHNNKHIDDIHDYDAEEYDTNDSSYEV